MKLNIRQEKTIKAKERKILCLASAASGKSRVLSERVKYLIERQKTSADKIVCFTFTNIAANTMKERLGDIVRNTFVGTIHSYANKICLANGIDTEPLINKENFDGILKQAINIHENKYPEVEHLMIDECQDLSPLEHQFIRKIPYKNIFWCGDARQMIYGFRGSSEEFLKNMYYDEEYAKYFLRENYRNPPNIIKFAENFLASSQENYSPPSIATQTKNGTIEECSFYEAIEELEYSGNWSDWAILTRTNAELVAAQELLTKKKIPNVSFKKGDLDNLELEELMNSDKVKILTIHTSKGDEFPNVIVMGAKVYSPEERRISYVAATRAMKSLYWCPTICKRNNTSYAKSKQNLSSFKKSNVNIIEF